MDSWHRNRLSLKQAELVETWLPGARLVNDCSWQLSDTVVLEVEHQGHRYIVKAGRSSNHHILREIEAHQLATAVLVHRKRAPKLVHSDTTANVLVAEYLEGCLVEGHESEYATGTYVQAGSLLRAFHEQTGSCDPGYESAATAKTLAWLEGPHRIDDSTASRAKVLLRAYKPEPVIVVPTHGDWQPRNWLVDGAELKVIDFGRYALRPAATDLCRLAVQQWRTAPQLESAFFAGYGSDPRRTAEWKVMLLREAVSTAAWAYQVGDEAFEKQGHRILADALENF